MELYLHSPKHFNGVMLGYAPGQLYLTFTFTCNFMTISSHIHGSITKSTDVSLSAPGANLAYYILTPGVPFVRLPFFYYG